MSLVVAAAAECRVGVWWALPNRVLHGEETIVRPRTHGVGTGRELCRIRAGTGCFFLS